jgi:hypothetical protein
MGSRQGAQQASWRHAGCQGWRVPCRKGHLTCRVPTRNRVGWQQGEHTTAQSVFLANGVSTAVLLCMQTFPDPNPDTPLGWPNTPDEFFYWSGTSVGTVNVDGVARTITAEAALEVRSAGLSRSSPHAVHGPGHHRLSWMWRHTVHQADPAVPTTSAGTRVPMPWGVQVGHPPHQWLHDAGTCGDQGTVHLAACTPALPPDLDSLLVCHPHRAPT